MVGYRYNYGLYCCCRAKRLKSKMRCQNTTGKPEVVVGTDSKDDIKLSTIVVVCVVR